MFEKMPFLFWREFWIQVLVFLLQLYVQEAKKIYLLKKNILDMRVCI